MGIEQGCVIQPHQTRILYHTLLKKSSRVFLRPFLSKNRIGCDAMKYAAAYIRVSTERQDEYSPESQLERIRDYAKRNDYIIPDEYVFYDDGVSGRSVKKRLEFNNMIAHAKSKEHPFDAILVWKFSRFARNQEESIVYKSMLKRINVSVISVSESIDDDSPFAPLIERIIEFMDEYYSTRLSQEVLRGMTEKASRGEAMCAAAFGYKIEGKTYTPDENAEMVKYIFDSYLAGNGFRKIAVQLTAKGVRTTRGNKPDNRFVEYVLQNPVYIGKIRWSPEGRKSTERYKGNNAGLMIVDGKHKPIIDETTFYKVQEMIMEQKKRYGKNQRREQPVQFMLKGLVRCSSCGSTLVYISAKDPAMQCHSYAKGNCNTSHYLSVAKANKAVIEAIESSLNKLDFEIIPKSKQIELDSIDYDSLIKAEQEKIRRASEAFDAGIDTLQEYATKKRVYQSKIDEYISKKQELGITEVTSVPKSFAKKVSDVLNVIKSSDITEAAKNEALRSIIDHITYDKKNQSLAIFYYI